MEQHSERLRIGPLPGGRRGTPGASAGCYSMRSTGGGGLSRRVPPEQLSTADNSLPVISASQNSAVSFNRPTEDVSQGAASSQPATTKAGKPRVRMKWDKEVNLFIMRTYLYITKLETDKVMYPKRLFDKFKTQYPDWNVSQQRIADQRRVIIRNKLISENEIAHLKSEIAEQLRREADLNNQTDTSLHSPHLQSQPLIQTHNIVTSPTTYNITQSDASTQTNLTSLVHDTEVQYTQSTTLENPQQENIEELKNLLETALTKFQGTDPKTRPKLPRLKESKLLHDLIYTFNTHILPTFFSLDSDLLHLHTLIYCSALVIITKLGYKIKTGNIEDSSIQKKKSHKPAWEHRLENDIKKLRADIGRLTQYLKGNRSKKVVKKVEIIFKNTKVHTIHERENKKPEEYIDTLKQKLSLKSHRLARYRKALNRKQDNKLYSTNEKAFYRSLNSYTSNNTNNEEQIPNKDELKNYWTGIWEKRSDHNLQAKWIEEENQKWGYMEQMEFIELKLDDLTEVLKKTKNWKAAGIDQIHNFWYKKFTSLHDILTKIISDLINCRTPLPNFITTGLTYMLPKNQNTHDPSQYRPITCLPTIYKIITSCITNKIVSHLEAHNVMSEEQKGCRRNHRGCKEQLIIDSTILKHSNKFNRNLYVTYIDFKKAFDSVPHSWLVQILQTYKIHPNIIKFLEEAMSNWRTTITLTTKTSKICCDEIHIRNGIFQGDSLSPLWFCLALNPLSRILSDSKIGYQLTRDIAVSHLMYMDDIKLFSKSVKEMKEMIKITAQFSKDINMNFGLDKCKTLTIKKGKLIEKNYEISEEINISEMLEGDLYKYLGILQAKDINHSKLKQDLTTEYIKRVNQLCKKHLYSRNLIRAINTFAIPVLTYSFGIIKWSQTDIKKLEIKTRVTLTKHNYHHPKSAIERLTLKRQLGGRGVVDLKILWQNQIHNIQNFFYNKANTSKIHAAIVEVDDNFTPLNLKNKNKEFKTIQEQINEKIKDWRRKELHGRHIHDLEQNFIDLDASNKWLQKGYLFPETEGFLIAIQDQVINTRNYKKYILKESIESDLCRKCHRMPENIQHITGACPTLVQTDYTHRHNQIVHYIHQKLAHKYNFTNTPLKPYYEYQPNPVLENEEIKIYYDRAILTDKTIHYNRPDITLVNKSSKIAYLIDVSVPNTHNLLKTITEKINKYTELKEEIIRIWNLNKVFIVPIVLSTTGVIPKHLHQSLKILDLPPLTYITMQKAAILNTCRIVRKFLESNNKLAD
ncbi:uncharacterized protein LOC135194637 [Vanessa tameamea]|uniref:Uncharacterized protein LOC135194637 n=1 Tax=Vanessa tameamea TaxID=334116 RepID=A0ABM4AYH9_VANTA